MVHVIQQIITLFVLLRPQKDVVAFTCHQQSKYVGALTTKIPSSVSEYMNLNRLLLPPQQKQLQRQRMTKKMKIDNDNDFFDDEQGGYDRSSSNDDDKSTFGGASNNIELLSLNDTEGLSDEMIAQLQEGQPSQLAIMKEILGINIFTYILAGLITIFLSLNFLLGPGWLGQLIGLEGTGTFTQISDSLPDTVDLSSTENLL